MLVVIVDFADAPRPGALRYKDGVDQFVALTVSNAQDVFFANASSTAARFLEMSHGLLTVTGDVIEVDLAINIVDSVLDDWRLAANTAAFAQGYDTTTYDRVSYLLAYGYQGQFGTGGAIGTYSWATGIDSGNVYLLEYIYNHELGHTLDLDHAQSIEADDSITAGGDESDFMGLAEGIHTAAINKYNKGWLDGVRNADHPVDTSAIYNIYPLAETSPELQTVVIDSHGTLPAVGAEVATFVSYRKPIGFDDDLSLVATDPYGTALRDTVHVHHALKSGGNETYFDRALEMGAIHDSCGTTIEVISINSQRARVEISQLAYDPVAPDILVLPQGVVAVDAGTPLYYDLSITNNDSGVGACGAFYDQEIVGPGAGWIAGWVSASLSVEVSPGDTEVFNNFVIQAPIGTAPGNYNVSFKLTNNGGAGASVESTVMIPYKVLVPTDMTAPTAPTNLVATEYAGFVVVLEWTASTDDVGVQTYLVYHNGDLLPDGGNNAGYADFPAPTGGYEEGETNGYIVYAIDAAGNVSPPSNWIFVGDDLLPPTVPTDLAAFVSQDTISLDWTESTDNVGVTYYEVHRDGEYIAMTNSNAWDDSSVVPGNTYMYTVMAWDGFGNSSSESDAVMATAESEAALPPVAEVPSLSPLGCIALVTALVATSRAARRKGD